MLKKLIHGNNQQELFSHWNNFIIPWSKGQSTTDIQMPFFFTLTSQYLADFGTKGKCINKYIFVKCFLL